MKKFFVVMSILLVFGFLNPACSKNFDTCRILYNDKMYHKAANCFYYKIQDDVNWEYPKLRLWYAAALYYDRQYNLAYYQYNQLALKYPNTKFGEYAAKEAKKVKDKIAFIKQSKVQDFGNYIDDLDFTARWMKQPIKVWVEPSQYDSVARQAFSEWQTKSQGLVQFKYVYQEKQGEIKVYFVDYLGGFDEKKYELGNTQLKYSDKKIYSASVRILQKTQSGHMCSQRQLYNVILHEIGHALGMMGHSKNNNDIMYETDFTHDVHLSQKDINTLRAIYRK